MQGLIMKIRGWYEVDYAMVNKDHGLGFDYRKSWLVMTMIGLWSGLCKY